MYYKIGDFAVISRVSVKMLRHYDELGLFVPAHVDPQSGYRFYVLDQLPRLHRLMALKELGFSLAEIGDILNDDLSIDALQALAHQREADLAARIAQAQHRLERLQQWRRRIELEDALPDYEFLLLPFGGVDPALPPPSAEAVILPFDAKSGLPTDVLIPVDTPQMPAAILTTLHQGDEVSLFQAYLALDQWMQGHHYQVAGIIREINHGDGLYEIQIPVQRRG